MINSNSQSVSVREFAKQVGRSKSWISKLAISGKLPRNDDGSIPLEAGFKAYDKLVKEAEAKKRKVEPLSDDDNAPMAGAMSKAMNVTEAFNKARLAEKTYQAKLKELEFE